MTVEIMERIAADCERREEMATEMDDEALRALGREPVSGQPAAVYAAGCREAASRLRQKNRIAQLEYHK